VRERGIGGVRKDDAGPVEVKAKLQLREGRNVIEVIAFNGLKQGSARSEVTCRPSALLAGLFRRSLALCVGINRYAHLPSPYQLRFAVKDAEAVAEVLKQNYGFDDVRVLRDEQATKDGITDALSQLASRRTVQSEDRVLIFFAGHGKDVPLPDGGEMGFLLPCDAKVDVTDTADAAPYLRTCLSMDELRSKVAMLSPAKHMLFLVDCCFSGLAAQAARTVPTTEPIRQLARRSVKEIVTAGEKGQQVVESDQWGHSAFTFALLKALSGMEADRDGDGVITSSDLWSYLTSEVPRLRVNQTPQHARFTGEGQFLFIRKQGHGKSEF
jgi:uncharacterized caspase-like protein